MTLWTISAEGINALLITGAGRSIKLIDLQDLFAATVLCQVDNDIVGVGMHFEQRKVFFSDASGEVWVWRSNDSTPPQHVYRNATSLPTSLSVDWLFDKLYMAEEGRIVQCSLDGATCRAVVSGIPGHPATVQVDPFNGFLFWSVFGVNGGLFRVDLADLDSPGPVPYPDPIVESEYIRAFALDPPEYRLYYPTQNNGTVMSVYLHRENERRVVRTNSDVYLRTVSMTYHQGVFYWNRQSNCSMHDSHCLYIESKSKVQSNEYDHQPALFNECHCVGVNIWHPLSQPPPVPLMPPKDVQALMSTFSAMMTWAAPDLDQGKGAWQDWRYEVEVITRVTGQVESYRDLRDLSLTMHDLRPSTDYGFRVRAYSEGGHGPWSVHFNTQTLQSAGMEPIFKYATDNGHVTNLYSSLLNASSQTRLPITIAAPHTIRDLVVCGSKTLWSLDNGSVYVMDGQQSASLISGIHATVLAYDWLANYVYWSNSKFNMIQRLALHRTAGPSKTVHQGSETVTDLALDSVHGYMYWATNYRLESARLNGRQLVTVYKVPVYAGLYIFGLALDRQGGFLYYLLKKDETLSVFRAGLRGHIDGQDIVQTLGEIVRLSPQTDYIVHSLQFYSQKLYWLSGSRQVAVFDTSGSSLASMTLDSRKESQVTAITVVHPSLYARPDGYNGTDGSRVIPEAVNMSSVRVAGPWDAFILTWVPSSSSSPPRVLYQLTLKWSSHQALEYELQYPTQVVRGIPPYTQVQLTIRACSIHGCAPGSPTKIITTPMAVPDVPELPRVFVTHRRVPWCRNISTEVEFRWFYPSRPNGLIHTFKVSFANSELGPWTVTNITGTDAPLRTMYPLYRQVPNVPYYFKVSACNDKGCSPYTTPVMINTSDERPVPMLVASINNTIKFFYPDVKKATALHLQDNTISLTFLAHESAFFWIDREHGIFTADANNDTNKLKLVQAGEGAVSLTLDWVSRYLYWVERGNVSYIKRFDLSGATTQAETVLSRNAEIITISVQPFHSSLFWSEIGPDGVTRLLKAWVNGTGVHDVFNSGQRATGRVARDLGASESCHCPDLLPSSVFTLDNTERNGTEIVLADEAGNIWDVHVDRCVCQRLVNVSQQTAMPIGLPPDEVTADKERVYWSNAQQQAVFSVHKAHPERVPVLETHGSVHSIMTYGDHVQPLPADPECMVVQDYDKTAYVIHRTSSSLRLRLAPWSPPIRCQSTRPTVQYTVLYQAYDPSQPTHCESPASTPCGRIATYDLEVNLTSLLPYTQYSVRVGASNFYTGQAPELTPAFGPAMIARTEEGVPSAPRSVHTLRDLPASMRLKWLPPLHPRGIDLVYVIQYDLGSDGDSQEDITTNRIHLTPGNLQYHGDYISYIVTNLRPGQSYTFKVLAYDKKMTGFSASTSTTNSTYQLPARPALDLNTPTSLRLLWTSPTDASISSHTIEYSHDKVTWTKHNFVLTNETRTVAGKLYNETIKHLQKNTKYYIRLSVIYTSGRLYFYPSGLDTPTAFTTLADHPSRPPSPTITSLAYDGMSRVEWRPPDDDGGLTIELYQLESCVIEEERKESRASSNSMGIYDNWTLVYNGTETQWLIDGLAHDRTFVFRVAALNSIGWSAYSKSSEHFVMQTQSAVTDELTIALSACFAIVLVLACIVIFFIITKWRKQITQHPAQHAKGTRPVVPDVELATLRELPWVQVQTSNALYAINIVPTNDDVAALPHYLRDQLTLTKFLGSGAFGEVFEGIAKNILSDTSGETKVAVKTLRKGATDQEKEEFLKEALLMSNFKHEHILRLLGVCLDNDPQFIILELMEGGDLLSFLRQSRPSPSTSITMGLPNMVSICLDVARGCEYLEEMHFVHRDLAARNCLVSTKDPRTCSVKIGDFGLARDIYKNDYYRKEGEGLLPVRWMSPESLIDGFFTTQSDVWAFGVLMWEVLTLGQQPYPARTNLEVLHFVRSGGRLDAPVDCPDDLYNLMLACWSFTSDDRPSFHYLLGQLEGFTRRSSDPNDVFSGKDITGLGDLEGERSALKKSCPQTSTDDSDSSAGVFLPQRLSVRMPNGAKKPYSESSAPPKTRAEHIEEGYLQPLINQNDYPKYLELIDSNASATDPPKEHETAVGPSEVAFGNQSRGRLPKYAKFEARDDGNDTDCSELASDSHSSRNSTRRPRDDVTKHPNKTEATMKPKRSLNYIQVATSDDDADNSSDIARQIKYPLPNSSRSHLNYAQLATNVPADSDIDTDNEAVFSQQTTTGSPPLPSLTQRERFFRSPPGSDSESGWNRRSASSPDPPANCTPTQSHAGKYYNDSFC